MLNQSEQLKQLGNDFVSQNNYEEAIRCYSEAIVAAGVDLEQLPEIEKKKVSIYFSNRSLCHLNLGDYESAISDCDNSLHLDHTYTKAYFRRAQCFRRLGDFDSAFNDLKACLHFGENSKFVLSEMKEVQSIIQDISVQVVSSKEVVEQICSYKFLTSNDISLFRILSDNFKKNIEEKRFIIDSGVLRVSLHHSRNSRLLHSTRNEALRFVVSVIAHLDPELEETFRKDLLSHRTVIEGMIGEYIELATRAEKIFEEIVKGYKIVIFTLATQKRDGVRSLFLEEAADFLKLVENSFEERIDLYPKIIEIISAFRMNLSFHSDKSCDTFDKEFRDLFLADLLVSRGARFPEIRQHVISCLIVCIGPQLLSSKTDPATFEYSGTEKSPAPLDDDLVGRCTSILLPRIFSRRDSDVFEGLTGLLMILQASPKTGHILVNSENCLKTIMGVSAFGDQALSETASAVLAVSSSDTLVRNTVAAEGYGEIFLELIDSLDNVVSSHAGLALAKLSMSDQASRDVSLKSNKLLKRMLVLVQLGSQGTRSESFVHVAVEAISYITVFYDAKLFFIELNQETLCKDFFNLVRFEEHSLIYGVCQTIVNLTTSVSDIQQEYNAEIEQLKKLASKGLNSNQERDVIKSEAGTLENIIKIRKAIVDRGVLLSFSKLFEGSKHSHLSTQVLSCVSRALSHMSEEGSHHHVIRGKMVQQGMLRVLLILASSVNSRCVKDATKALARIAIVVNPKLYPLGSMESMIAPILKLLQNSDTELEEFECLLALTNFASSSAEIRSKLYTAGAWYAFKMSLSSENWKIQVAAIQAQTNMVSCDEVLELLAEGGEDDLRIFIAFCKCDDVVAISAACGALAMVSYHPGIASKLEKMQARSVMKQVSALEIPDLTIRANAVISNLNAVSNK